MGISMSDSIIAEGNRLSLKARALTSITKKNISLNHKSEGKNLYLAPRAFSHSDQFQLQKLSIKSHKKMVRVKNEDPETREMDKTPVFAGQNGDNYMQSALQPKQREVGLKRKIKRINKEENNYFVFATKQEKAMDIPINCKVNDAKSPEIKLPLNSVIEEGQPVKVSTFSEFRKVNTGKKGEINVDQHIVNEPKGNRINELLIKLKNQKKQSNNLLEKYLPKSKSKKQQLEAYTYGLMMPKQEETIISSIMVKTVKQKKKQPEEALFLTQKIYTNWKQRTDSLRKSNYIIQSRDSYKVNSVCQVYGIEMDKKPVNNQKLKQFTGLNEKRSAMKSQKQSLEKSKSKDRSNLHSSSWRSEGKLKLIHF